MSETWCNSNVKSDGGANNESKNHDLLDLQFDPSNSTAPSLRQPKLSEAQLLAALELGFSGKYLPSSVAGREPASVTSGNSVLDSRSNKVAQPSSMINNHSNSNINQGGGGGSQNQYPLFVDNYSFNLTEEQQEGLLPPLRRPDINQLPPDVLAVLLKSTRFEEILIPTQRRLTEITPNSANSNSSRSPGAETDITTRGNLSPNTHSLQSKVAAQQTSSGLKPGLSPLAKEFVPSSFQTSSAMNSQHNTTNNLAYAMSQVQVQGQEDSFQGLIEELDGSDCILSTVTDMISQVSQDPASLNRCAKATVEVLKKHLNDEDTLGIVVTLLVEQMISNSNFCYSGAKILEMLRENGIGGQNSIKQLVLTRMHEEFTNCLNNIEEQEVRNRSLGVLRLLSELYMNFAVLPDKSKLHIFALAVLELMVKLIQKDQSIDTVKCVCQLLKLIGWEVENSNNKEVREYFGMVLKELSFIKMTSEGKLHPTCEALLDMIFKLHSNKWNRGQEEASSTPSSTSASYVAMNPPKHPVYYELPDSDDDSFGDDVGIMIDDEPDEVQAAYEEFLKMSSKK